MADGRGNPLEQMADGREESSGVNGWRVGNPLGQTADGWGILWSGKLIGGESTGSAG